MVFGKDEFKASFIKKDNPEYLKLMKTANILKEAILEKKDIETIVRMTTKHQQEEEIVIIFTYKPSLRATFYF